MSVTARKIGSAPILVDWSQFGKPLDGYLDPSACENAKTKLQSRFDSGEVGYALAPSKDEISQHAASREMASRIRELGRFTDCLWIGIGGSYLGPLSLLQALEHKRDQKLRFHFIDNPDPEDWKLKTSRLSPESTLVCVVTKSGTTFETVSLALLAMGWLGKPRWKSHLVFLTDPEKGDLRQMAKNEEIPSLPIHPSLGGRFSVFSPVGLFPAALAGLDTAAFLKGAQQALEGFQKSSIEKNPLLLIGSALIAHFEKKPIHVCMPYSTRLQLFADWFVQLWGESLGKDGKGFTPLAALGASDQHSLLQLLRDGPEDKVTIFVTIAERADPVPIPKSSFGPQQQYPALTLLEGHSLAELLTTEYRAVSMVLAKKGRPQFTVQIDRLDETCLGALYMAFCHLTALTGTLWGVNPFDQPGVEEGKVYIREALAASKAASLPLEDDTHSAVSRLRRSSED